MSLRRCLSIVLTFLMLNPIWVAPLFAKPRGGGWTKYSPGQLQAALRVLGTGREAHVAGKLRDKTTFSGYLSQVEPRRFLVMDARTTTVIPVSYVNVKELRAENTADGVQFAARVSLSSHQLDIDEEASNLSLRGSALPSKARMDRSLGCRRVSDCRIRPRGYRQKLTL
jgi:hypothetical protein